MRGRQKGRGTEKRIKMGGDQKEGGRERRKRGRRGETKKRAGGDEKREEIKRSQGPVGTDRHCGDVEQPGCAHSTDYEGNFG